MKKTFGPVCVVVFLLNMLIGCGSAKENASGEKWIKEKYPEESAQYIAEYDYYSLAMLALDGYEEMLHDDNADNKTQMSSYDAVQLYVGKYFAELKNYDYSDIVYYPFPIILTDDEFKDWEGWLDQKEDKHFLREHYKKYDYHYLSKKDEKRKDELAERYPLLKEYTVFILVEGADDYSCNHLAELYKQIDNDMIDYSTLVYDWIPHYAGLQSVGKRMKQVYVYDKELLALYDENEKMLEQIAAALLAK